VVASGPVQQVMTQKNLSETFGLALKLVKVGSRYAAFARS
jgi:iron complex transport system ATP-binding protein